MQSCIYAGQVEHRRVTPVGHSFRYRVFMMYLDLAELPELFGRRWFWSAHGPAPARFSRDDHFGDPRLPLDRTVRDLVGARTGRRPAGPVRLLTHLRYFGYCFNPVSFYYCFAPDGERLEAIVAEVSNTPWGERHCYVLPVEPRDAGRIVHRFQHDKQLHVSPFMPMDCEYDWRLSTPADRLAVHMRNERRGARIFDATLALRRREITAASLAHVLLAYPAMTAQVITRIYWQALRLWLKGTPCHPHPSSNSEVAANDPPDSFHRSK